VDSRPNFRLSGFSRDGTLDAVFYGQRWPKTPTEIGKVSSTLAARYLDLVATAYDFHVKVFRDIPCIFEHVNLNRLITLTSKYHK